MPLFKKSKDKEYAIIGLGRFGGSLARRLDLWGTRRWESISIHAW